jgi:hypothetical protein
MGVDKVYLSRRRKGTAVAAARRGSESAGEAADAAGTGGKAGFDGVRRAAVS